MMVTVLMGKLKTAPRQAQQIWRLSSNMPLHRDIGAVAFQADVHTEYIGVHQQLAFYFCGTPATGHAVNFIGVCHDFKILELFS